MKQYFIHRIDEGVHLDVVFNTNNWENVPAAEIDNFPWHVSGARHRSQARLLHNSTHLFAEFYCEDTHISSRVIELNGMVSGDSCVELFACPDPEHSRAYFNIEINATGTLLLAYGSDRYDRRYIDFDYAKDIKIWRSIQGLLKDESPDDRDWRVIASMPYASLSAVAGRDIAPREGARWTGNFHRCGGRTNPQHACWAPISTPMPDFHQPDFFGDLLFT